MKFPFTIPYVTGATPLTAEQAALIFTPDEIAKGEKRGEITTCGPWQIIIRYRALAVEQDAWPNLENNWKQCFLTIHGPRSLTNIREFGYELEGRVSVRGKKHRGFTSSMLFELPDGKLIDCAIIHVCKH